jgi:hypothetical protein
MARAPWPELHGKGRGSVAAAARAAGVVGGLLQVEDEIGKIKVKKNLVDQAILRAYLLCLVYRTSL